MAQQTFGGSAHDVVLIAPSGREQPATLRVSQQGISLATPDKELNRFPFEVIVKWLPSHLRSRNPGSPDCLDLQIMTDKGPRDLRMRCASEAAVQAVMDSIQVVVQELMQEDIPTADSTAAGVMPAIPSHALQEPSAPGWASSAAHPSGQQAGSPFAALPGSTAIPVKVVGGPASSGGGAGAPIQQQLVLLPYASQPQQLDQVLQPPSGAPVLQAMPAALPADQLYLYAQPQLYAQQAQPGPAIVAQLAQHGPAGMMPGTVLNMFPQPGAAQVTGQAATVAPMPVSGGGAWPWSLPAVAVQGAGDAAPPASAAGHASLTSPRAGAADPDAQEALMAAHAEAQTLSGEVLELQQQNEFLEGVVKRLAAELSRHQSADGRDDLDPRELAMGLPDDAGIPLPPWLRERRYLNPLLVAYDERVTALEKQLERSTSSLEAVQRQVEEVVVENDRLRVELQITEHAATQTAARRVGDAGTQQGHQERVSLLLEENALLRRENDMLLSQQADLDAELQRLHQSMEDQAMEVVTAAREGASAATRVQATEEAAAARVQAVEQAAAARVQAVEQAAAARVQAVEDAASHRVADAQETERQAQEALKGLKSKVSRCQSSLRSTEGRAFELEQELQAARSRLEDEAAGAAVARRALEDCREQCAAQVTELTALGQRCRAAVEGQATLQVELTSLREKYEEAATEVTASHRQLEALLSAVSSLEQRLAELQNKDTEAYGRIQKALEEAEQARLARDSAVLMHQELQREVHMLKERLANMRQTTRDTVYAELQSQIHESAERLRLALEEAATAVEQASDLRTHNERLQRDIKSLGSELAAFKASLQSGEINSGATGPAGASGGYKAQVSLVSLAAVERIQELERSRDEAVQKLESTERQLDRFTRNWQLERQTLEVEVRELRQKLTDADGLLLARKNDVVGLSRQVDALARELQAAAVSRSRLEEESRTQGAAVRAERDQEVRTLAAKLESVAAASNRSLSEAERIIEAKEALLAQWREETQAIAGKMERAAAEHRRQLAEQAAEVAALAQQVESLQHDNAQLLAELGEARTSTSQLQVALEDAESRGAALGMQLLNAQTNEEELQQELRTLSMALERTRASATRDARQARDATRDKLFTKYTTLKQSAATVVSLDT